MLASLGAKHTFSRFQVHSNNYNAQQKTFMYNNIPNKNAQNPNKRLEADFPGSSISNLPWQDPPLMSMKRQNTANPEHK